MTLLHGKGGSITWAGTAGFADEGSVTSWNVNVTLDTQEFTSMATTHKAFLAGFLDWTATVDVIGDGTDKMLTDLGDDNSGSYYDCKLEMVDGTHSLNGNAICVGATATTDKDDVIRLSYSFEGSGALGHTG